jgi:cobalt-zinc-cadmium efflux system protein
MKFWKANSKKSYGYIRAEIIVAFINSSTLLIIGFYIIYEAFGRLFTPEKVVGKWLIIVAGISFIANALSTYLLHQNSKGDLNAKSAYLHLFYDAMNSLFVVIAGILIYFYNWYVLDPIFSIVIGLFIIKSAWDIILETVNILSEGTPREIDPEEVQKFIASQPDVKEVHHLHIWSLSSNFYALSAHVVLEDQLISKGYLVVDKLEKELSKKFGIEHPTFQLEADLKDQQKEVVKIKKASE